MPSYSVASTVRKLVVQAAPGFQSSGYVVSGLIAVESVSIAVGALGLARSARVAFAAACVVFVAAIARRGVSRSVARRVRETLVERIAGAVFESEPSAPLLGDADDAVGLAYEVLNVGERLVADVLPSLVGSAIACAVLAVGIVAGLPGRSVGAAVAIATLSVAALLATRTWSGRVYADAARRFIAFNDAFVRVIVGRFDLVANARERETLDALRASTVSWSRATFRAQIVASASGRLVAVLAVAAVVIAAVRGGIGSRSLQDVSLDAVAAGAVIAPFVNLVRAGAEIARSSARIAPGLALFDAPRASRGAASPPRDPKHIVWRNVVVEYPRTGGAVPTRAVDDATLDWSAGRILLLVGPNGSGKSTLLKTILALAPVSAGSVHVDDTDVATLDLRLWRTGASYLPQRPYFGERATVRDSIALFAPTATDADAKRWLERLGVWSVLEARASGDALAVPVGALSVGQRQRVAIARALSRDARVLVLDEPDANLDASGVADLAALLRELAPGRMIAVAAHTPELARCGDDIVRCDHGRISLIANGEPRVDVA